MMDPNAPGAPPAPEGMLNVPVMVAQGGMRIDVHPNGVKMLMIGPLVVGIPLGPEQEKWLADALNPTGVLIVPASGMPGGGV